MAVKKGDKVKIEYTGTLDDGTVFDSSEKHGKPLEFEVGKGMVIKGLDEALIGMKKGQEKEITIKPEKAYGEPNPKLTRNVPLDKIPKDPPPRPGMILVMQTQDGRRFPAMIKEVTNTEVTIDLNHPLAGKTLHFKIKVVDISKPEKK